MKKNILLLAIILGIIACNPSENTKKTANSVQQNTKTNTTNNTSTEADAKWISMGYDLEKGKPQGLKAGMQAPDFQLNTPNGELVHLSEELKKQPVVLIFYRGQWCPLCTRYLAGFQENLPKITAKGAKVIAITPETNEGIAKTVEDTGIDFTVLHDSNMSVISDYKGLFSVTDDYQDKIRAKRDIDIAFNNGKTEAQLPVPATYVIGQDGVIKFAQFDLNFRNRASADEIVKYL